MPEINFPKNFIWGTSTSSYSIEGAVSEDGRSPSIWDTFCAKKGNIHDKSNAETACDHYHRFGEDISIMKKLGIKAYRFSTSWCRVFPEGTGKPNRRGIGFYDKLIDQMLKSKIKPFLTLYHWDLPQSLQDKGGWKNRDTANYFADYAEYMVKHFGDRVDNWITINEPLLHSMGGHLFGQHAPGKHDFLHIFKINHNLLLAHAFALDRIKIDDKKHKVGICNTIIPIYAYSHNHVKAANKVADVMMHLFMDPIFKGKYPERFEKWILRQNKGNIKPNDMVLISRPVDFLGVNHYSRFIVKKSFRPIISFSQAKPKDARTRYTDMKWEIYPKGIYDSLMWIKNSYGNPPVYITENGASFKDKIINDRIPDIDRINYIKAYLAYLSMALDDGANVMGYFLWSLLDNFEWDHGYSKKFGIVHVDFKTLERKIKDSGFFYSDVIRDNGFSL